MYGLGDDMRSMGNEIEISITALKLIRSVLKGSDYNCDAMKAYVIATEALAKLGRFEDG